MPRSMLSRWKMPMTSTLVRVSRLPVGSSARMIDGSLIERSRDRDTLLLAAGKLVRIVVVPLTEPDGRERRHRALVALGELHLASAVVEERQFDVVERGRAREQVEALEHETNLPVPDRRELVFGHPRHILAVQEVLAAGRPIQAAEDVHERGLAGAGRTRHGDELTLLDVEVRAAQRADDDLTDGVGLEQVPNRDDRHQ